MPFELYIYLGAFVTYCDPILVYYLLFLAETFMMCVNIFYVTKNEISIGLDKKWEISP